MNADGIQERKLLHDERGVFSLTWLPDGLSIAFSSPRDSKAVSDIFRINVDGTGLPKSRERRTRRSFTLATEAPGTRCPLCPQDLASKKLGNCNKQAMFPDRSRRWAIRWLLKAHGRNLLDVIE
jgi:hypothetical protein